MTLDDIKLTAYKGCKSQWNEMSSADRLLWYELTEIYESYHQHMKSKDECSEDVSKAVNEWKSINNAIRQGNWAFKRMSDLFAALEEASSEYRKNPNIETANRLMEKIYRIPMERIKNEQGFAEHCKVR